MKSFNFITILVVMSFVLLGIISCKPQDADIKQAVENQLATNPNASGISIDVNDGVVTLSGEVKDETTAIALNGATAAVKNVKSVNNNLRVVKSATNFADKALNAELNKLLKEYKNVGFEVSEGVVTLSGEVSQEELRVVMQKVSALSPAKIENQFTVK